MFGRKNHYVAFNQLHQLYHQVEILENSKENKAKKNLYQIKYLIGEAMEMIKNNQMEAVAKNLSMVNKISKQEKLKLSSGDKKKILENIISSRTS